MVEIAHLHYPDLDTPCLLVDLAVLEENISRMSKTAADAHVKLRPHTKTHKSPFIAHRQIEAGARGITVAKLGEAEVMVQAGITDILIAYPLVGEIKLNRLKALSQVAHIRTTLDSLEVAAGLSELGQSLAEPIPVLIEVDTGLARVGLESDGVMQLAHDLKRLPGITLSGLLTHAGHVHGARSQADVPRIGREEGTKIVAIAEKLRQSGVPIAEVSVGSTPTARHVVQVPGVTEVRPGTYVFNDVRTMELGEALPDQCALTVLTTVVSTPARGRAIIDAGSKTITTERESATPPAPLGWVRGHPELRVDRLSEEHGVITFDPSTTPLRIGDRLEIIPNHVCPVVNLADRLFSHRHGNLGPQIEILGRGKNR
jgi:D-serine deaminase-like pyridoxal phosphate-dependent protein